MIKIVLPLIAAAGLLGAAPPAKDPPTIQLGKPAALPKGCHDTIELVREANGLPRIERRTASPDAPLFIAAVDYRIDDCRVLMMANNSRDIRPEPSLPEGAAGLMPAR